LFSFSLVTHQYNGHQLKEQRREKEEAGDELIDYLFMRTSSNRDK